MPMFGRKIEMTFEIVEKVRGQGSLHSLDFRVMNQIMFKYTGI